ncbi:MAG: F0F1 ATP synthase subunit A [Pseudomonadota bacterium]
MEKVPFTFFERYVPGVTHDNLHVVTAAFVVFLLAAGSVLVYPRLKKARACVVPDGRITPLSLLEIFLEMLVGLCEEIIGPDGRKYFPFIGSIFFFIFISNLIGLVPGFLSATGNWVTGAAVATISFLAFNYFGFREHGVKYLKHFMAPISPGPMKSVVSFILLLLPICLLQALFGVIEIMSTVFRPMTLSIRLYANMLADHEVISIFSHLVPWVIPILFMILGVFVSFMQAFIFTLLTTVYISGAVASEH